MTGLTRENVASHLQVAFVPGGGGDEEARRHHSAALQKTKLRRC